MKWVAIDLGRNEIKAAVRGFDGMPAKLLYNDCGRLYSYMPSVGFVSNHGKAYVGNNISLLDALYPVEIGSLQNRSVVMDSLFKKMVESAKHHYNTIDKYFDKSVGAVLLYDNIKYNDKEDSSPFVIAKQHFSEVQQKCSSEVLSSVLFNNEGTTVVVDVSMSALKISIVGNAENPAFFQTEELRFSQVDISEIMSFTFTESMNETELYIQGLLLEKTRMCLCHKKEDLFFLDVLKIDTDNMIEIYKKFEDCMTRYFYRCFDICTRNLRTLSKSWNDVNNIVFCGGGSNYYRLEDTFTDYLRDIGMIVNHMVVYTKDAQWAAVYNTLKLPLFEEGGVCGDF